MTDSRCAPAATGRAAWRLAAPCPSPPQAPPPLWPAADRRSDSPRSSAPACAAARPLSTSCPGASAPQQGAATHKGIDVCQPANQSINQSIVFHLHGTKVLWIDFGWPPGKTLLREETLKVKGHLSMTSCGGREREAAGLADGPD